MNRTERTEPIRFACMKALTIAGNTDVHSTFQRMASLLQESGVLGKIQFRLLEGDQPRIYAIQVGRKQSKAHAKGIPEPDVEIVVSKDTWWDIASSKVSPLEMFVRGRMRVRGNHRLAAKIASSLAVGPGRASIC